MKPINIPDTYNYIGVFITFACNLRCSYCINNFEGNLENRKMISGEDWARFLNRINSRDDLPVTLQGGEPSLHKDFIYIINNIKPDLHIDILTNLSFDIDEFMRQVDPKRLVRNSPYACIRVSYHPETMDLKQTMEKVLVMMDKGFSIGIWSVMYPDYRERIFEAQDICRQKGIDFRLKEFLGEYNGKLYGTYKYKDACSKKTAKTVSCKASELLIDPAGTVFRCHHDVYSNKSPIGSLSDGDFQIEDEYRDCQYYGFCNPCDIKVKTNRLQEYGHTSVDIKF